MNLKYDGPLSNFAFNCNLRHYATEAAELKEKLKHAVAFMVNGARLKAFRMWAHNVAELVDRESRVRTMVGGGRVHMTYPVHTLTSHTHMAIVYRCTHSHHTHIWSYCTGAHTHITHTCIVYRCSHSPHPHVHSVPVHTWGVHSCAPHAHA